MSNIVDKDRRQLLVSDGDWHPLNFRLENGRIVNSVGVGEGIPEGVYLLQYQLRGKIVAMPATVLELRVQRYPIDTEDAGTAYDYIDLTKRVTRDLWFGTRHAKVEVRATGNYSRKIGIDYRFRGGSLTCTARVLKFVEQ